MLENIMQYCAKYTITRRFTSFYQYYPYATYVKIWLSTGKAGQTQSHICGIVHAAPHHRRTVHDMRAYRYKRRGGDRVCHIIDDITTMLTKLSYRQLQIVHQFLLGLCGKD